jgi:divalent metal cation (Fe/Co/Zn/Cd) transporter
VEKIIRPEEVAFSPLSIAILVASIGVKLWMYVFNRDLGRRISSAAMAATAADALSDCVATAAVLLGLVVGHVTGYSIDGWVGVLVALFVLRAGWGAVQDTLSPLLGQAPDPELVEGIEKTVRAHTEILGLHDLVVHDYGPGHRMATLHAEVPAGADIMATHDVIDNVERELGKKFHLVATIHMDPVVVDDARVNELRALAGELAREIDPAATIHDFRMTEGPSHTNLIFDMVLPRSCPISDGEAAKEVARLARERDPRYRTVVQVDHPYVTL